MQPRNRAHARDRARKGEGIDHEQEHEHDYEQKLPPHVLGILALEFLLYFRIALAPEGFQVIGDLDRAMVRREDLDSERNAATADTETARSVV